LFKSQTDPVAERLIREIQMLSKQVAELKGEKEAINERRSLSAELTELREELELLKIEKARREEDHARERREVEHATGLHRKQSEWERTKAVEEARLTVREENLSAERKRFEEQLDFSKAQIQAEVDRMEKLIQGLMDRLPTVTVEKSIDFAMASNGKGSS
jgi:chromosome segregation ATPase